MAVYVGSTGVVGFSHFVRPMAASRGVQLKSSQEVLRRRIREDSLAPEIASHDGPSGLCKAHLLRARANLCPARIRVSPHSLNGYKSERRHQDSDSRRKELAGANPAFSKHGDRAEPSISGSRETPHRRRNPLIEVGMYFDRLDYPDWRDDAATFWGSFYYEFPYIFGDLGYSTNLRQFKANFPWMWEHQANAGYSQEYDQSNAFAGSVHLAIVEGHGSPLSILTFQDNADPINLQATVGFGGFNAYGGSTSYLVWRGCCVVSSPDPADAAGGCNSPFTSNPTGPWFNLFKGLRGTYGFHSQMTIQDHEGPFLAI